MEAKFNLVDSLKLWGIGDVATAARQLSEAGLGDASAMEDALMRGDFCSEALARVRELAPKVAAQFPHLAQAVGYGTR